MTKDEELDLALEALDAWLPTVPNLIEKKKAAITAIKQARALDKKAENARELGLDYEPVLKDNSNYRYDPPVAEPVAWAHKEGLEKINDFDASIYARGGFDDAVPLYINPPAQRQWVGLTKEERVMYADLYGSYEAVLATEAKLKERNV
jgi:hypothetical protein